MNKVELMQRTKAFLFDLDGTLYLGDRLIGEVPKTLDALRKRDQKIVFLTNNSAKTVKEYQRKLETLNLFEKGDLIYTSASATISFLLRERRGKRVYLLGTEALKKEFVLEGVNLVEDDPDICVQAYDTEITYEKISRFNSFLRCGAEWILTHADEVCPTLNGSLPDAGAFLALFRTSSKRDCDRIVGKPYRDMAEGVLRLTGVQKENLCMVGDRMYTDIRFANQNGFLSVLVLSGETSQEEIDHFPDRADLVLRNVNELVL